MLSLNCQPHPCKSHAEFTFERDKISFKCWVWASSEYICQLSLHFTATRWAVHSNQQRIQQNYFLNSTYQHFFLCLLLGGTLFILWLNWWYVCNQNDHLASTLLTFGSVSSFPSNLPTNFHYLVQSFKKSDWLKCVFLSD